MSRYIALYIPVPDPKLLRTIGLWCNRFTPFVGIESDITPTLLREVQNRKGLVLDMVGMHRMFPSLRHVAQTIYTSLQARHVPVQVGVASTVGAAWAFSRFSSEAIYISDERSLKEQLKNYPVAALRLTEDERRDFQELGLQTVENLLAIPTKELAQRFGFSVLKKVDLALGGAEEPLRIFKTKTQLSISTTFDIPLTKHESVKECFFRLLEQLLATLQQRGLQASSFYLKAVTQNKEIITRNISLYTASKNISHVSQVLQSHIESIKPSSGISFVAIAALHTKPIQQIQGAMSEISAPSYLQSLGELLNLYRHTLGDDSVKKAELHQSYIPERSFSFIPLDKKPSNSKQVRTGECKESIVIHTAKGRPSYLLTTPEPINAIAMLPDKAPSWITWRQKAVKIIDGVGPERIAHEWWLDGASNGTGTAHEYRDYFKVRAEDGNLFWVFRNSSDFNWFIHGLWV